MQVEVNQKHLQWLLKAYKHNLNSTLAYLITRFIDNVMKLAGVKSKHNVLQKLFGSLLEII